MPDILGTDAGISALSKFLEKSGAFTKTGKPPPKRGIPEYGNEPHPTPYEDNNERETERSDEGSEVGD